MDDADDFVLGNLFFLKILLFLFCNLNIFKVKRTRFFFLRGSVQNVKKSSFE